ncbi:potasium uptake protein with TrkA-C domain [Psychromonas ingrahamii 37]|uniref:Potasium uptake protein with TrkA-C domain n=1 Tax=Psychromonas ingrahamii (strain DSM 17664 / CCUG 51855 / 37) TaxID=357804 RepID=A1ST28_PSYIN|nr:SLC13 family permease [Psychromonas ingrahamii]ABM02643.1 potasium uptake protein with TrkA-C domain [Psychromonas ingrahamii 37]
MNIDSYFVLSVFVGTIIGLIKFQQRPAFVFGITLLILFVSNMVSTEQVVSSFANQGLLTLILLLVCSLALEKTRFLRMIATKVIHKSYGKTFFHLFSFTVLSSALLNNTAVVSTMLAPIRNNPHHAGSKLLLPLSYAAILGGTLTLVGTSTNLIVNSLVIGAGLPPLSFFDFTLVGICLVITCGIALWFLSRFLPEHHVNSEVLKTYFIDAKVGEKSTLVGKTIEENGFRQLESLFLVEIVRAEHLLSPVPPTEVLQINDRLIFSGDVAKVQQLNQFDGLSIFAHHQGLRLDNLTEVVIRPESVLLGRTLKKAGFRALFDAAVVAIKRDGENLSGKLGEVTLNAGDYLVLAVGDDFKSRRNISKNFILVSGVELDSMLSGGKALLAILGFFAAILGSALGLFTLFKGLIILLGLLILTGSVSSGELLRRLPAELWLIISSALALSYSLKNSGLLDVFSVFMDNYALGISPLFALVIIYILTWLLTELVTNNAAAALIFPIAYGLAVTLDANPMAFIMAVAFGASGSFVSPYGYQTNLMVFNAGQYKLIDFVKIGLPVSIIYGVVAVTAITLVFGL